MMANHYADMMEIARIARIHQELYAAGMRAGSETSPSAAKLRQLLNRLEHVKALWDADEPMKAYAELIGAMRDAKQ